MKKITANKAAAEIRHKILRKMEELENTSEKGNTKTLFWRWDELKSYIKGMATRASAKKGGLGRK